jgi:hypothetical protein
MPLFLAASAKGTNFLMGDDGMALPLLLMLNIKKIEKWTK